MLYFIYRFGNFGKRVIPYWIIIITIIMIKLAWEQEIQDFLHWSNCLFPAYWHCVLSRLSSLNLSFPICKIFKTFNKLYIWSRQLFHLFQTSWRERWHVSFSSVTFSPSLQLWQYDRAPYKWKSLCLLSMEGTEQGAEGWRQVQSLKLDSIHVLKGRDAQCCLAAPASSLSF